MLEYTGLTKHRQKFLVLTRLTPKEFKLLLPAFCEVYESVRVGDTTQSGQVRQRHVGGGRKGQLRSPEEKLLFILVYQKAYPLQTLLGEVFELSQARVHYWGHHLLPLLQQVLAALELLAGREPRQFAQHERKSLHDFSTKPAHPEPVEGREHDFSLFQKRDLSSAVETMSYRSTDRPPLLPCY